MGRICGTHLAERVKYLVEIYEDLPFRDLRDIVQAFRREIPNSVLRI